jgi:hypothetical protein
LLVLIPGDPSSTFSSEEEPLEENPRELASVASNERSSVTNLHQPRLERASGIQMIPFQSSSTKVTTSKNLPPLLHPLLTDNDFLPSLEDLLKSANTGDRDTSSIVTANQAAPRRSTSISPKKPFLLSSRQSYEAFVEKKNVLASTINHLSIPLSSREARLLVFTSSSETTRDDFEIFEIAEEGEWSVLPWQSTNLIFNG